MLEQYGFYLLCLAAGLGVLGYGWLLVRAFKERLSWRWVLLLFPPLALLFICLHFRKVRGPMLVLVVACVVLATPYGLSYYERHFVPARPYEQVVDGEVRVTLTGLKDFDYATLQGRREIVVLQLAGWRFKRQFVSVHQMYTFGAPMVGNEEAAKTIDREFADKIFRYVNLHDPIPRLPTVSLLANQYTHCQKEILLGAVAAAAEAVPPAVAFFQQMASKTVDGVLQGSLIDDVWKAVLERVSAHLMENYRHQVGDLGKKA